MSNNGNNFTFPHLALVESRVGPLWHGTQAFGADKRKSSDIIQTCQDLWWM